MISVEEALQILDKNNIELPSELRATEDALRYTLAEHVIAPFDFPSFQQSAMDGFALNYQVAVLNYKVVGEIAAGSDYMPVLKPGEAVRIFTGAMVPESANTVAPIEIVNENGAYAELSAEFEMHKNIRPVGEQIKKGEVALKAGTVLTPAGIGFLIGLGIQEVSVIRKPKLAIVTTGNELIQPGNELKPGQIFESNSFMLKSALENYSYHDFKLVTIRDDFERTKEVLGDLLNEVDFIFISGGISVGKYDFVSSALHELGVSQLFYKVNQKPGKPLYTGKIGNTIVMALPGNPAATLTCFYVYGLQLLNQMTGIAQHGLETYKMPLFSDFENSTGKSLFLKGQIDDGVVKILDKQSSAMLASFAYADVLIYIPANKKSVKKMDFVTVYKL